MKIKYKDYLKIVTDEQDRQLYFRVHKCEKCGRYTRYIYAKTYCYECHSVIINHKNSEDVIPKAKYYYKGDIIDVDGIKFGYKQ